MVTQGRPFSGADASWWHMEEPTNHMAITAVLVLDAPLQQDRLRSLLASRLLRYDRFRARVVEPAGGIGRPRWVELPDLCIDDHLVTERLPEPGGAAELQARVGREMGRTLDDTRPLWRIIHVQGYRGGSALIARIHHCIADGLALVHLLLELDDEDEGTPRAYWGPPAVPTRAARVSGDDAAGPVAFYSRAAASLGRLAGMRPDPRSALRGHLCGEKRAAWSEPFDLGRLRRVARGHGATLNDVIVSTVAGGLGRYLERSGDEPRRGIRAVIPVNLRSEPERCALGNRFGLVFAPLPLRVPDPVLRLGEVRRTLQRIKQSPQAGVVFGLLELFGRTPRRALDAAVSFLGSKASLVLTNVPGPRQRVRFCGAELVELIAWVPQSGHLALGVSALTYGDELRFGIAADAALLPRPTLLVTACEQAAAELLDSAASRAGGC